MKPVNVGELKAMLAYLDDAMPVQGEMQGELHWDWTIYVSPKDENEDGIDIFTISMDL